MDIFRTMPSIIFFITGFKRIKCVGIFKCDFDAVTFVQINLWINSVKVALGETYRTFMEILMFV